MTSREHLEAAVEAEWCPVYGSESIDRLLKFLAFVIRYWPEVSKLRHGYKNMPLTEFVMRRAMEAYEANNDRQTLTKPDSGGDNHA